MQTVYESFDTMLVNSTSLKEMERGMLILTRRTGERLRIADNIIIDVLGIKGNQIRLGLTAPEEVKIFREEIYMKIKKTTTEAQKQDVLLQSNAFLLRID